MGFQRDAVDVAAVKRDQMRASYAGGPKQIAKDYGRPRGSDRFPSSKSPKRRFSGKKR